MKLAVLVILGLALVVGAFRRHDSAEGPPSFSNETTAAHSAVLVELFTSEGCSSCPPADALLAQLDEQQPVAGAEIVALEEHVDYWDRQGWVDPFSGLQWTERQQDYAGVRHDNGIYTPEMVVDGRAEFVGSHEKQARQAIAEAASQQHAKIEVAAIGATSQSAGQFRISIGALPGIPKGERADVWLAITETGLHSAVKAGENAGVDVHHSAVVRSLRKIGAADPGKEPSFAGDAVLKLDKTWKRENLRAVVFVQEKRSHHVLGTATTRLPVQ